MKKETVNKIIYLTKECLERYWQHDYMFVISHCSDDVLWIGSNESQFMQGLEAVEEDFEKVDKEIKKCHLINQEYAVSLNCKDALTVNGRYFVTTDADEDCFLQVCQRCTFVWKLEDGEPKIKSIHVSNPLGELFLADEESFPNALGKRALKYLNDTIATVVERKKFSVTDNDGIIHFLYIGEVQYIEAHGRKVILHLINGEICAQVSFSAFLENWKLAFVLVHRSYAVNPLHIQHIVDNKIVMQNGDVIPLPLKKASAIKRQIDKIIENG